jgi:hypothetical protein
MVADAQGFNPRPLAVFADGIEGALSDLSWSPDSQRLAFIVNRAEHFDEAVDEWVSGSADETRLLLRQRPVRR